MSLQTPVGYEDRLAQEVAEQREHERLLQDNKLSHELSMKRIDLEMSKRTAQSIERLKTFERVSIALIKLPLMPFVLFIAAILWIKDRDLPADLDEFIDL